MNRLDRVVRIGQLLDLYGPLLTERQREFVRLHYCEDMSYNEVGELHGVSRQAVHDAARHGLESMEKYEAHLRLLDSGRPAAGGAAEARRRLEELVDWVRRQGVIYDTKGIRERLQAVIGLLAEGGAEAGAGEGSPD